MILAEEVFPIPGGPLIKQAFAFGFGASAQLPPLKLSGFLFPFMTTSSQSLSQTNS